jgi:hypothetical protein
VGLCLARGLTTSRSERSFASRFSLFLTAALAAAFAVIFHLKLVHLLRKFPAIEPFLTFLSIVLGAMFVLLALSFTRKIGRLLAVSLRVVAFALFLMALLAGFDKSFLQNYGIAAYSARSLSLALVRSGANSGNLRLLHVRRSSQYQLNFYFHAQLQEWDGQAKSGELLLGDSISCARLNLGESCKDLWGTLDKSDSWQLLAISPPASASSLGSSPSGGSTDSRLDGRQPR